MLHKNKTSHTHRYNIAIYFHGIYHRSVTKHYLVYCRDTQNKMIAYGLVFERETSCQNESF